MRPQVQQENCSYSSETFTLKMWIHRCIHAEQDAGNRLSSGLSIEQLVFAEISRDCMEFTEKPIISCLKDNTKYK